MRARLAKARSEAAPGSADVQDVKRAMDGRRAGCALLAAWCLGLAGCAGPRGERPNAAERAILSTYVVASEEAMGTGFLVAVTRRGKTAPVFVTSTHLVDGSKGHPLNVYLRFVTADGTAFVTVAPLSTARRGRTHVVHPFCDVAAFPVDLPAEIPPEAVLPFVEEREIDTRREVRAGDEVVFAGFPEGVGGPSGVFAVLRAGRVASFEQSFLGLPFFMMNSEAHPGDSGAPVFVTPRRGRPRLVGMVVEYVPDAEQRPMPLSLAVDAGAIRETIDMLFEGP
jgi:hypothetical protein